MPTIYDNKVLKLIDALRRLLAEALRADFCVGYLNLRGWGRISDLVESFSGDDGESARILVGMHRPPREEMRAAAGVMRKDESLDLATAKRLHRKATESFREQLQFGVPSNDAETALRELARQIREGKVRVKLFLRYPLHAKLYLLERHDPAAPLVGYVGSSNLTLAGLSEQGELNVDVLDQDAAQKLSAWFEERWEDKYSIDISDQLVELIETSWAAEELRDPYLVYLKMAYHLSEDVRAGETEFKLPPELDEKLLDFQKAAVSLAARHIHVRGGVLLADVVGLGKTFVATAIARILQDDEGSNALILCPKHLVDMWEHYRRQYDLIADVVSTSMVTNVLPDLRRYRLVIIDESHNFRNREGIRYGVVRDYIEANDSRCLLVTATPYNKEYTDLSAQLRLFISEDKDLGVRPERYFADNDEGEFIAYHQASPRSIVAFEQSEYPEDWRDLLRLYMVRRTRNFVIGNYATKDEEKDRYYLSFQDGTRFYFPKPVPHNLTFDLDEADPQDQYARLYHPDVVTVIERLNLPRYGLANYLDEDECQDATATEQRIFDDLSRAGRRLKGFCRTNLFKRLESSGSAFLLSVGRHILRNLVTLHAIENGLEVPIGTQDAAMLDPAVMDEDDNSLAQTELDMEAATDAESRQPTVEDELEVPHDFAFYQEKAAQVYEQYITRYKPRFRWLPAEYFTDQLASHLREDSENLHSVLARAGEWDPDRDAKLAALQDLLQETHADEKVLVFTQFADTVEYLSRQLQARGVEDFAPVTGASANVTKLACRFSPVSNDYTLSDGEAELQVLIATDCLSEGQNLQDAYIVVNYDLPWAIIRLLQRAGRVDRIGQQNDAIHIYSFVPADGVERIIDLKGRLIRRLVENEEVVGAEDKFFPEQQQRELRHLEDLYTENANVFDELEDEDEVDLASLASQIWNSAAEDARNGALRLPPVVYATRPHEATQDDPAGVITYMRMAEGTDALVRVSSDGGVVSNSLSAVFRAATCSPDTPALDRQDNHHELVAKAVETAASEMAGATGRLGSSRSTRRKVYDRLSAYYDDQGRRGTLLATDALRRAIDLIYHHTLTETAKTRLGRTMRGGIQDGELADLVMSLYDDDRLCVVPEDDEDEHEVEPQILCSLGLKEEQGNQ